MRSSTVLLLALSFTLGQATLMPPIADSCTMMDYTKIPFCYTAGYPTVGYPTANGIETQEQAQMQLNDFRIVVQSNCSGASLLFLCSYYAPPCFEQNGQLFRLNPCRELCEAYYDGCYQNYVNSNISWPAHLNCNLFPNRSDEAICFITQEDPSSLVLPAVIPGINAPIPTEVPTSSHPPLQSTPLPSILLSVDPPNTISSSLVAPSSSGTILSTASSSATRPISTPTLMASPSPTSFSESPALHCSPLLIAVLLIILCLTLLVD
ncbi:PREDICTED: frizzled-2-like [Amphimedon queenslandica]|uniref:FZ domain-containing protein n=1 Tax=Amphimedon queenslandica TaxID=400682 RepID=A0A1X7UD42_AMPQE|nr:PREDICTED: frizzled-2-like [Amphimedon queenslandica]|eukprot:XP_003388325.1 PREDICTED: frizzled-2-like [Amphimedon queenslandica]